MMSKPVKVIAVIFSFFLTFTSSLSASTRIQDVEVGFSPERTAQQIVMTAIEESEASIDIAAYSFTSKPIALALIDAQQRGVNVRVVADKTGQTHTLV